jgi:tetratricopeptide (TPR) repeat protein
MLLDCQGGNHMKPGDPLIEEAFQHFRRNELAAAESILTRMPDQPSALHLLGVLRVRQHRLPEAAELLARSVAIQPKEAQAHFNLAKVQSTLGRKIEAVDSLRAALALDASLIDATLLLAKSLESLARFEESIQVYRQFLLIKPSHVPARLGLGKALIALGRLREAEQPLLSALSEAAEPRLCAKLHQALAYTYRQRRPQAALEHLEKAQALGSGAEPLEQERVELLEDLQRFEDAKAAYRERLEREPINAMVHQAYNELLYRLGEEDEFLSSYDRAPRTKELMLSKAAFFLSADRHDEAERCYRETIARYSDSREACLGVGLALVKSGRYAEAVDVLENLLMRFPESAEILCNLAGALSQAGDPEKANAMALRALDVEPVNQFALAMLGTSWRLMGDTRDEHLNGYDEFIHVFDLDPPDGYSDMASFNMELGQYLATLHPPVREFLRQSLRGGTQTRDNLFGAGHVLVDKLKTRIDGAVARYIDALDRDDHHPFLSRKASGFAFSGSWSSRLRDCGFHINHLHPGGWISSCYYVEVPGAVRDDVERQGWIKFGEPSFDVRLPVRRAVQPVVGRLVLFPSFMWHGTVPFHDSHARTTVAFDVVPA